MLAVFPYFSGDAKQMLNLLAWISELGGCKNHDALLVADADTPWEHGRECHLLAGKSFKTVSSITNREPVKGWIPGSSSLFRAAAQWSDGKVFTWVESDAVPLRSGWLDDIEQHYRNCRKLFMGSLVRHANPGWPNPYLEGCAVYPADCWKRMAPVWNPNESWTRVTARAVVPHAANSEIMVHLWGEAGNPPTFALDAKPGTNVFSLAFLRPEACLFHRNKDGTLIQLLRKKLGIKPPVAKTTVYSGLMRVVSLRRAGDIISLLPLLQHVERKGKRVELVVHSDFMPLLEGVSNVDPIEWKGSWEEPMLAAMQFNARNAQVYGKGIPIPRQPSNFVREAWKRVGHEWNRYLPLDFDLRDFDREEELAARVFKTDRPKILCKLHGFSSPFPHTAFVKESLQKEFGEGAEIVWLDDVKAARIYDLLGLMDRADCLVSVDTATLHLARSHRIPVVALVNGSPWGSTPRMGNVVHRCGYGEVQVRWPAISDSIRKAISPNPPSNGMALVYSSWTPKDPATKGRMDSAFATWPLLGARLVPYANGRSSRSIGDGYDMPFLHDMVGSAMATGDEQIIAVSNNDIWFDERLAAAVADSCRQFGCYWAHRLDQAGGATDNGVDFVAFTRKWWSLHKDLIPDFIFGAAWWDDITARVMQWSGCREQARLYYHRPHPLAVSSRGHAPHMKHSDRLAREWMDAHGESKIKPTDLLAAL